MLWHEIPKFDLNYSRIVNTRIINRIMHLNYNGKMQIRKLYCRVMLIFIEVIIFSQTTIVVFRI